jgi:hypothetical protein
LRTTDIAALERVTTVFGVTWEVETHSAGDAYSVWTYRVISVVFPKT